MSVCSSIKLAFSSLLGVQLSLECAHWLYNYYLLALALVALQRGCMAALNGGAYALYICLEYNERAMSVCDVGLLRLFKAVR